MKKIIIKLYVLYVLKLKRENKKKQVEGNAAFCDKATEETKLRNGVVDINKEKQERRSIKWKGAKTEETISCNLNYKHVSAREINTEFVISLYTCCNYIGYSCNCCAVVS